MSQLEFTPVLDACCGSRMFWYDRADPRVTYMDKRRETHELKDSSSVGGTRTLVIDPDVLGDFTAMPFPDASFSLVCFDPPHLVRAGKAGWLAKKYGVLGTDWREDIRKGFAECFRVLRTQGTLVFKWNKNDVPVREILALTPERPLFGNQQGKNMNTHWIVFMKV